MKLKELILEIERGEAEHLKTELNKILNSYNLYMSMPPHALQRLFVSTDQSRAGIDVKDFIECIQKFLVEKFKLIDKYRQKNENLTVLLKNSRTHLNIVFSLNFNEAPISNSLNPKRKFYRASVITAMLKKDFGSDNFHNAMVVNV